MPGMDPTFRSLDRAHTPEWPRYPTSPEEEHENSFHQSDADAKSARRYQTGNEIISDHSDEQSETWTVVKVSPRRAQEAEFSDGWSVLDKAVVNLDEEPGATQTHRASSEAMSAGGSIASSRGIPPRDDSLRAIPGETGTQTETARRDKMQDAPAKRPQRRCARTTAAGRERSPRQMPRGPVTGKEEPSACAPSAESQHQREQRYDAESLRRLEYSSRMRHAAPPKARLEALSDVQSLRVLEYWTQKRAVERSWAAA